MTNENHIFVDTNVLIGKFTVIDFSAKDIPDALSFDLPDIEDCIQYIISAKFRCNYFVTNNRKDYVLNLFLRCYSSHAETTLY